MHAKRKVTVVVRRWIGQFVCLSALWVVAGGIAAAQPGEVWAWGKPPNEGGVPVPTRNIEGLTNVLAVSAGFEHSLALRSDGTVWAWGNNNTGQLGDETFASHATPVRVPVLKGVTTIATSGWHNLVLKSDGTVWAWGYNAYGQLGDGTFTQGPPYGRAFPMQVNNLTNVVAIAAGINHSMAVKSDGTVWTWGWNNAGQLGDGTTNDRATPAQVSGLTDVVAVAGGTGIGHSLALKSNGTVWAWGSSGNIGNGTLNPSSTPVQVSGLTNVIRIAAGSDHSLVLKSDGTVRAWGNNDSGQLGDGTDGSNAYRLTPVAVQGLTGVVAIAAGGSYYTRYEGHSLALKSDGTVWAWGWNQLGQLGDGNRINHNTPVLASDFPPSSFLAAGRGHSLVVKADGTVRASGSNQGLLTKVVTLTDVIAVNTASSIHKLALKADGTVWAWGNNTYGQLGNGQFGNGSFYDYRFVPQPVSGLMNVTAIATGYWHSLAIKSDGTVWTWGSNEHGRLGDGTTTDRPTPIHVSGLTQVVAIAGGTSYSLALKSDGTVWAWGDNTWKQLGDGTTTNRTTPVRVSGLTNVVAIATGDRHSLAVKADGRVWAWGQNGNGQLGDGTTTNRATPVQVSGLTGVVAVSCGSGHSLAIKADGTVWAWGANYDGQLGINTDEFSLIPVQVLGPDGVGFLTDVVAVSADYLHSQALKSDGTVWTWGSTPSYGQVGNGTYLDNMYRYRTPVPVIGLTGVTAIGSGNLALVPTRHISGTLSLESVEVSALSQPITFTFRDIYSDVEVVRLAAVGPNGVFTVPDVPSNVYTLHIKGMRYLAANTFVNASFNDVSDVTAMLPGGDANEDNSVDVFDLDVLIQVFNASLNDPNYDPGADFNADGSVDVFDLDILIRNFNSEGAP